jgi:hypothetical protein
VLLIPRNRWQIMGTMSGCRHLNSISPDLWRRCHPRARTRFWHCWWLFFSWSKIFSFPFIKHAFSYNTVFNGFFEDKSNVVKLKALDQLKFWVWRHCEDLPGKVSGRNSPPPPPPPPNNRDHEVIKRWRPM